MYGSSVAVLVVVRSREEHPSRFPLMVALVVVQLNNKTPILRRWRNQLCVGLLVWPASMGTCEARKTGPSNRHCSLEEPQPFRILEVPLWMLDAAVCPRICAAEGVQASVESLRELKAVLSYARSSEGDVVVDTQ
jgi:hypothetical protein